jgi:hypothetical protein
VALPLAGVAARVVEHQECERRSDLGGVGDEVVQDGGEPYGFSRQVSTQQVRPGAGGVPGCEGEIDRSAHLVET